MAVDAAHDRRGAASPAPRTHEAWFAPGGSGATLPNFLPPTAAAATARILSWQLDQDVRGSLVEVGAATGGAFLGLALAARPDETVAGIDPFPDHAERTFLADLDRHLPNRHKRVLGIKADSRRIAVPDWIGVLREPARLVHLAGARTRAQVLNDLYLAAAHHAPRAAVLIRGFLDVRHPELTEGVVDGLRASRALVPVAVVPRDAGDDGGTTLVCAAREAVQAYRGLLRDQFGDRLPAVVRFAGHDVITFDAA